MRKNRAAAEEFRDEAQRLALASRADQRAIVALHRSVADDKRVSKANREEARQRADALEKLLGLGPKLKKKKM
jgi:predicted flap endonuclease-1-like 5' DNA nuclease